MADKHLSILMLGAPNIIWQGQSFSLPRRQARALLFRLARALEPVSRQQLGFIFWPDEPDTQARRNLNRLLSYLHKALPLADMLLSLDESVQLNPSLVWSDSGEFITLCEQENVDCTDRLIDLYRGSFLEGFYLPQSPEFDFWLADERQLYERLYLSRLANRLTKLVLLREYQRAISYAQSYLKIDNLAEEIYRQLIICYAAAGNRAAAQNQYEQMVLTLERELGVQPLPETVASYSAVLRGELPVSQQAVPEYWGVLPSLSVPLLGRQQAWQQLQEASQKIHTGGFLLISGEAGIGKSRILKEFATQHSQIVINGTAHSGSQNLPYRPVIQALRLALPLKWLWQAVSPIWLAEIALILPEIRQHFPELPERIILAPQQSQARLFEGLTQVFLCMAAKAAHLMLCFDDLHWADPMTLEWLNYLAPRLPHSNLSLLATCRSEESDRLVELRRLLNRTGVLLEIHLNGLSQSAIQEMVDACGAAALIPQPLLPRLHQITGGNPFFLLEIISAVLESGRQVDPDSIPISQRLHTVVETRLSRLTTIAHQILEACAVLAPRLEFDLIVNTSGRHEGEVLEALGELSHHYLLETENDSVQFRHELIRQAVYRGLAHWRCQLLHKRAAAAFEASYKKNLQGEHAQIAYHYDHAGQAEGALEYYHLAAEFAQRIYAYQTAIQYLQRAIQLLPAVRFEPGFVIQLHETLGDCQVHLGDFTRARQNFAQALELLGQEDPVTQASVLRKRAAAFGGEYAYDDALPLLEEANSILEAHPDIQSRAWQHIWLDIQFERIWIFYLKALPDRIEEIAAKIRPVIERAGTPQHQIRFITGLNYAIVRKERYQVSKAIVDSEVQALGIAEQLGDAVLICERKFNTGILCLLYGDLDSAILHLSSGLELAQKIGLQPIENQCLVYLIAAYRRVGRVDEVQQRISRCLEVAKIVGNPNYIGAALAHQAWLGYRAGELEKAQELALQALELWEKTKTYPFQWMGLWLLLEIASLQGAIDTALQTAAALLHPIQQAMPVGIQDALQSALSAHQAQQPEKTRAEINKALQQARQEGYL